MPPVKIDFIGITGFMIAMMIGAWGVYNSNEAGRAVVILIATGLVIAIYILTIIRDICQEIGEINKRQAKWFEQTNGRRSSDRYKRYDD